MSDDTAAFGMRLYACRQSAGLSQEQLAERSGVSTRAISNLERGRTRWPHPDSLRRLADALGLHGEMRAAFFAAAGRRLAGDLAASADAVGDSRLGSAGGGQTVPSQLDVQPASTTLLSNQAPRPPVVPRELPGAIRHFVGRQAELAALTGLLEKAGEAALGTVVITAIGGMAGVGKTTLALHWAHQAADQFPDGQLYVDLRGFSPSHEPLSAHAAVRMFLDGLGVPVERIPPDPQAQAALYRSLLTGKRTLVVIDNARDEQQVRPLLPGSQGCLVVITSRNQMTGLIAVDGAQALCLDVLTGSEARDLLEHRLGAARVSAEPAAVADLIGLCARLPLALAIAAARGSVRPGLGLRALAEELKDAQRVLDALETEDAVASVRAVFSWSLENLQASAAQMFALLGLHLGPDITIPAAASLAGLPLPRARQALRELAGANLVSEHAAGRFAMHDLLRAYAAERAAVTLDPAARRAAQSRILDHYAHTARAAALLLSPGREPVALASARPGVTAERLGGYQQALAWFEAEHQVLPGIITLAADAGLDACAWQLPWAMADFLDRRGHWHQWAAIERAALAAATRLGDLAGQAVTSRLLATSCVRLGDYDLARAHLTQCLGLYRQLGDRDGQARAHRGLGCVAADQGRHADALGHDEQSLALYQAVGNQSGQAAALANVGYSHNQVGNYQQARVSCRQALALHRQTGDRAGLAHAWEVLGDAEHNLGNLAEAAQCYRCALAIFRDLGDRYNQANALTDLGDTCHAAGQLSAARDTWQQALDILDDMDHPQAGQVRAKLGQLGEAPGPATPASLTG